MLTESLLKAWYNEFKSMYAYKIDYLKKFLTNNVSNEIWAKLQRYYIDGEYDDELKDDFQDIMHEFEYNLNSSGIHLLKLSLKSSTSFQKVLERIQIMEKNISDKNSVSIVNPETRYMKDKKGKMGLNYNYQTVTDNKYGFRISHYITNNSNDQQELTKIVELTKERLHTDDFIICFDNGYWNPEQIKEVLKGNTMVVIPDDADARRKKKKIQQKNSCGKRDKIKEIQKTKRNKRKTNLNTFKNMNFDILGMMML